MTLTVQSLTLMLRAMVVGTGAAGRALFRPVIEQADLQNVPAMLDRGLVKLVKRALERRSERLAWDFGRVLGRHVVLPDTLVPLEAARVNVETAELRVRADALELIVSLTTHISRVADDRAADHRLDVA
jgi:hypothetical protein